MIFSGIRQSFFVMALCLFLTGPAFAEAEELDTCPEFGSPYINMVQFGGRMYQNHEKTAFELAREKSHKYGIKMPLRQGNMGWPSFRLESDIELRTYPSLGCIVLLKMDVKVYVDRRLEIAADYEKGSCMYNEFYTLEMELMQQDEEFINNELRTIRNHMTTDPGDHFVTGPVKGINIDEAAKKKEEQIQKMIEHQINKLEERLFRLRVQSDLPEFFDEIAADCAGGVYVE